MSTEKLGARIVVIGGGTGSFTVLSGLKHYAHNITALVNMADDGGSTGLLRDELGVLPPGDVRQCLVALSDSEKVRDLFNYRFDEGSLKGHAFGNLFLTALEKMTGNFADAVELASEVLNITGRVEPITHSNVTLCLKAGEQVVRGEFEIAHMDFGRQKPELWLEPSAELNPEAQLAIEQADMVVISPGNLYGSLAPALIVPGLGDALAASKAKKIYICNLVTKPGQTDGFSVINFADEVERLAGTQFLDYVLYNEAKPSDELLEKYAHDGEYAVSFDVEELAKQHYSAKGVDLVSSTIWGGARKSDPIAHARTFIRHDGDKVARHIMKLYFS